MSLNSTSGIENPAFGRPATIAILLPPFVFIAIICLGVIIISIISQPQWWKSKFSFTSGKKSENANKKPSIKDHHYNEHTENGSIHKNTKYVHQYSILTSHDILIFNKFIEFQNNPISLFMISLPILITLIFCPVTIFAMEPVINFFWPSEYTDGMPKINDVIAAFLMPAGLVYAVAFGFAMQDVLLKHQDVGKMVLNQHTLLRQTWKLVWCSSVISKELKGAIAIDLKKVAIQYMAAIIAYKDDPSTLTDSLWDVITKLQGLERGNDSKTNNCKWVNSASNDNIIDSAFHHTLKLEAAINGFSKRGQQSISFLQWMFLEGLGFISFFGILLLRADSYRLELTICMLTVFSVSAFSYVLADLDSPYHGTFKVCLKPFVDCVKILETDVKSLNVGLGDNVEEI